MSCRLSFAIASLLVARIALSAEIEGVQPAALDQPRVHLHLRREAKGKPLMAGEGKETTINIEAFLDTGASGVMLSTKTADALGVRRERVAGKDEKVVFHDVGVGGGDAFNVAEPLLLYIAPYGRTGEPDDADGYPIHVGPLRPQIGPLQGGIIQMLTGGLDVVGMPAIRNYVIVIDPKPVDTFGDTLRTGLFQRNAPTLPKTDRTVKTKYLSFARFTRTEPTGATPPAIDDNPFIENVVITMKDRKVSGTWLLDTGAAASLISSKLAEKLGIKETDGVVSTVPEAERFSLTIGGVGGSKKSAGFFLDTLVIPTREGDPLKYVKAPVLITDITVEDPKTKEQITLDGVLGMNYLVASAFVSEAALLPDIGKMTVGPFEWIVFDAPKGELRLKLKPEFSK